MEQKIKTKLTPCRYPGGKSNALKFLSDKFPPSFKEFREPFFGGGSVGLYLMQTHKDADFWINDLFYPVYCFWKVLYERPEKMVEAVRGMKATITSRVQEDGPRIKGIPSKCAEKGRELHSWCREKINDKDGDELQTACLWYILNKLSYSGMAMIGSYAPLAWDQNFTDNCITNLPITTALMKSVKSVRITNRDYSDLLGLGEGVFIFLDPPYKIPHNLYGKDGDMHERFDHRLFADKMNACNNNWMITYNDDPQIKEWFDGRKLIPWDLQYTMKAAKRTAEGYLASEKNVNADDIKKSGKSGKELLILNYI